MGGKKNLIISIGVHSSEAVPCNLRIGLCWFHFKVSHTTRLILNRKSGSVVTFITALLNINLRGFQTLYPYRLLANIPNYFFTPYGSYRTQRKAQNRKF